MKKGIIFIGLKVLEISVVVFVPWGLGRFVQSYGILCDAPVWVAGVLTIVIPLSILSITIGFIAANLELTKYISKRWNK